MLPVNDGSASAKLLEMIHESRKGDPTPPANWRRRRRFRFPRYWEYHGGPYIGPIDRCAEFVVVGVKTVPRFRFEKKFRKQFPHYSRRVDVTFHRLGTEKVETVGYYERPMHDRTYLTPKDPADVQFKVGRRFATFREGGHTVTRPRDFGAFTCPTCHQQVDPRPRNSAEGRTEQC